MSGTAIRAVHMMAGSSESEASVSATPTKPATEQDVQQPAAPNPKRTMRSPFRGMRPLSRLRRRRARSAPPALRKPLIEEHFRVDYDSEKKVVLPGVPKHDDDWARDSHDFFNLIVLIPIIALNVMNWNWEIILNMSAKKISDAWAGEWFNTFLLGTLLYFFVDLTWILLIPSCVKSPSTIIQHHLVMMAYILIPYFHPDVRWCMGACMSVEINTWFLIARRVFNKQGFPPWIIDLSFVSIRVKLISLCFYVTWIGIRCILYPILMVHLLRRWWQYSHKVGTSLNSEILAPILHSLFCVLNFKWTYDLIMSKIRYYKRRAKRKGHEHLSKGQ